VASFRFDCFTTFALHLLTRRVLPKSLSREKFFVVESALLLLSNGVPNSRRPVFAARRLLAQEPNWPRMNADLRGSAGDFLDRVPDF
jgi:hypothetical protein